MIKKVYLLILVCSITLSGCAGNKTSETATNNDYLAKSPQSQYNNSSVTLGPVDGISYVDNSGGFDIYYDGFWCGWLNIVDFGDENWTQNADFLVESNFSGTTGHYELLLLDQINMEYGNRFIYEGQRFPYTYSDTEWMIDGGIFTDIDEAYKQSCDSYIVVYGMEDSRYVYCLYLEKYFINDSVFESILERMDFTQEAFSEEVYKSKNEETNKNYNSDVDFGKLISADNVKNITYQITAGDLKYTVPKGTVAIKSDENEWILYCYSNAYGGGQEVGTIVISQNPHIEQSEEEIIKQMIDTDYDSSYLEEVNGGWSYSYIYQENQFSEEQRHVFLTDNKETVLQVSITSFD